MDRRAVVLVVTFACAGCWRSHAREADARDARAPTTSDAGSRDAGPPDAAPPDAGPPGCGSAPATVHEYGTCFELATCCADVDCEPGWECSERGYCRDPERPCFCVSDDVCRGSVCLDNEILCGVCWPVCGADGVCPYGSCREGYCVEGEDCVTYSRW